MIQALQTTRVVSTIWQLPETLVSVGLDELVVGQHCTYYTVIRRKKNKAMQ